MIQIQQFVFNPVQENTYVLYNQNKQAIIVDPGCYFPAEQQKLYTFISLNELTPIMLLNTHCHLDHIFGNKWVFETFGLRPQFHANEQKVFDRGPEMGAMWGLPFTNYQGPVNYLNEGNSIFLEEDEFKILFTPGHSPGSVCFYHEKQQFVIGGDVLFKESIGRTDLPGADHQTLLNSIRTQLFVLPDDVVVYSGHGPETTIGYEKRNNPFL